MLARQAPVPHVPSSLVSVASLASVVALAATLVAGCSEAVTPIGPAETDGGALTIRCTQTDCSCPDGRTCTMTCPNGEACYAKCGKGSSCEIDCASSTDCAARCDEKATCNVRRQTGASPTVTCAEGAQCRTYLGQSTPK
jgi:hypothetical protein